MPSITNIFDDDDNAAGVDASVLRAAGHALYDDEDDMDDFIEEDPLTAEEAAMKRERDRIRQERLKRAGKGTRMGAGVSKEVWEEIQDIFGNGTDYAWALEYDPNEGDKPEPTLRDVRLSLVLLMHW